MRVILLRLGHLINVGSLRFKTGRVVAHRQQGQTSKNPVVYNGLARRISKQWHPWQHLH